MERRCSNCLNWTGTPDMEDAKCNLLGVNTRPAGCCPGCKTPETTDAELEAQQQEAAASRERILAMSTAKEPVKPTAIKKTATVTKKRKRCAEPMTVYYDPTRPHLEPYAHQKEALDKYLHADIIPLFFEMGCGKSFTTLHIAQEKYKLGLIKGILVVAPNDVHRQWFDELVFGVDLNHDGTMWQEMTIDFQAQCVGGNGGQKELYPFERDDMFKFVSVNVDTFSQPHKWEDIVFWANSNKYMIALDEATSIKNPDSKRSQRLLYEFNNVVKRGKRIISSVKKFPVRAVLTGTPVTNGPMDLWSIMEFVQPNFFNRNYYSFRAYYGMFTKLSVETSYGSSREVDVLLTEKTWEGIHNCQSYQEAQIVFGCSEDTYMTVKHQARFIGPYKHADELKQLLDRVAMFRKLTDCTDMPSVQYIERKVGMSAEQQSVYDSMKKNLLAQYNDYTATASNKLVVNLRLQQISSGFIMGQKALESYDLTSYFDDPVAAENLDVMPNEVVWLGKSCPKLDAIMRDIAECDKPLLVLTRYSAEAAKIYELCKDKYRTGLFTGWKVIGGVDAFKSGDIDILVANSSKISRGFNLQNAHVTLFYSNTFSMETRQQAEFRTFRMGQKHPCTYIDYTAAECDETINKALQMKKGLLEYIRDKDLKDVV